MHNLISRNQLEEWHQFNTEMEVNSVNDYFECLIECDETQTVCKRICKELLQD